MGALTEASAGTDLRVATWQPSAPQELAELEPDLDDETSWVGVGDPAPDDGWHVEHLDAVHQRVWLELVEGSIHLLPEPTARRARPSGPTWGWRTTGASTSTSGSW